MKPCGLNTPTWLLFVFAFSTVNGSPWPSISSPSSPTMQRWCQGDAEFGFTLVSLCFQRATSTMAWSARCRRGLEQPERSEWENVWLLLCWNKTTTRRHLFVALLPPVTEIWFKLRSESFGDWQLRHTSTDVYGKNIYLVVTTWQGCDITKPSNACFFNALLLWVTFLV